MMVRDAVQRRERREWHRFPEQVYRDNPFHRMTEKSLSDLLVDGPSLFLEHAEVRPCLLKVEGQTVARFAFIHDRQLPSHVQVAFFEALPGLGGLASFLLREARAWKPEAHTLVVGLNGHLNYGAGILLDRFDEPPVFGLPYSPPWYADYFREFSCRVTVSYRFSLEPFFRWAEGPGLKVNGRGISVRFMDRRQLDREVALYTRIDNTSFSNADTPYWSNRLPGENGELFHPFRHLLRNENLIFAERNGEPVGFFLWYPDFNELVGPGRDLGILDVFRYRLTHPVRTMRFTEVALMPGYRNTATVAAMILKAIPPIREEGLATCEGGFIFEQNTPSRNMVRRLLERVSGAAPPAHRHYGIFEGLLHEP